MRPNWGGPYPDPWMSVGPCAVPHDTGPLPLRWESLTELHQLPNQAFYIFSWGRELFWRDLAAKTPLNHRVAVAGSKSHSYFYFLTDSWGKNYGEYADFGVAKSSLPHNYLNLTFPRKRTPRVSLGLVFAYFIFAHARDKGIGESPALGLFLLINYTVSACRRHQ